MKKINIVKSHSLKDFKVEVVSSRFCKSDSVYIMSDSSSDEFINICTNPYDEIKKLRKRHDELMNNRLKGLEYWKARALKG